MTRLTNLLMIVTVGLMFLSGAYFGFCALDQTASNHFSKTTERLELLNSQDLTPRR